MIPTSFYKSLPPSARIRAALSAIARNDQSEIDNLRRTCPRRNFLIPDPNFSDKLTRLLSLACAVEHDLQSLCLDWLLGSRLNEPQAQEIALAGIASLEVAWRGFLVEHGIAADTMADAGTARHTAVEILLAVSDGEENADLIEEHRRRMSDYFTT